MLDRTSKSTRSERKHTHTSERNDSVEHSKILDISPTPASSRNSPGARPLSSQTKSPSSTRQSRIDNSDPRIPSRQSSAPSSRSSSSGSSIPPVPSSPSRRTDISSGRHLTTPQRVTSRPGSQSLTSSFKTSSSSSSASASSASASSASASSSSLSSPHAPRKTTSTAELSTGSDHKSRKLNNTTAFFDHNPSSEAKNHRSRQQNDSLSAAQRLVQNPPSEPIVQLPEEKLPLRLSSDAQNDSSLWVQLDPLKPPPPTPPRRPKHSVPIPSSLTTSTSTFQQTNSFQESEFVPSCVPSPLVDEHPTPISHRHAPPTAPPTALSDDSDVAHSSVYHHETLHHRTHLPPSSSPPSTSPLSTPPRPPRHQQNPPHTPPATVTTTNSHVRADNIDHVVQPVNELNSDGDDGSSIHSNETHTSQNISADSPRSNDDQIHFDHSEDDTHQPNDLDNHDNHDDDSDDESSHSNDDIEMIEDDDDSSCTDSITTQPLVRWDHIPEGTARYYKIPFIHDVVFDNHQTWNLFSAFPHYRLEAQRALSRGSASWRKQRRPKLCGMTISPVDESSFDIQNFDLSNIDLELADSDSQELMTNKCYQSLHPTVSRFSWGDLLFTHGFKWHPLTNPAAVMSRRIVLAQEELLLDKAYSLHYEQFYTPEHRKADELALEQRDYVRQQNNYSFATYSRAIPDLPPAPIDPLDFCHDVNPSFLEGILLDVLFFADQPLPTSKQVAADPCTLPRFFVKLLIDATSQVTTLLLEKPQDEPDQPPQFEKSLVYPFEHVDYLQQIEAARYLGVSDKVLNEMAQFQLTIRESLLKERSERRFSLEKPPVFGYTALYIYARIKAKYLVDKFRSRRLHASLQQTHNEVSRSLQTSNLSTEKRAALTTQIHHIEDQIRQCERLDSFEAFRDKAYAAPNSGVAEPKPLNVSYLSCLIHCEPYQFNYPIPQQLLKHPALLTYERVRQIRSSNSSSQQSSPSTNHGVWCFAHYYVNRFLTPPPLPTVLNMSTNPLTEHYRCNYIELGSFEPSLKAIDPAITPPCIHYFPDESAKSPSHAKKRVRFSNVNVATIERTMNISKSSIGVGLSPLLLSVEVVSVDEYSTWSQCKPAEVYLLHPTRRRQIWFETFLYVFALDWHVRLGNYPSQDADYELAQGDFIQAYNALTSFATRPIPRTAPVSSPSLSSPSSSSSASFHSHPTLSRLPVTRHNSMQSLGIITPQQLNDRFRAEGGSFPLPAETRYCPNFYFATCSFDRYTTTTDSTSSRPSPKQITHRGQVGHAFGNTAVVFEQPRFWDILTTQSAAFDFFFDILLDYRTIHWNVHCRLARERESNVQGKDPIPVDITTNCSNYYFAAPLKFNNFNDIHATREQVNASSSCNDAACCPHIDLAKLKFKELPFSSADINRAMACKCSSRGLHCSNEYCPCCYNDLPMCWNPFGMYNFLDSKVEAFQHQILIHLAQSSLQHLRQAYQEFKDPAKSAELPPITFYGLPPIDADSIKAQVKRDLVESGLPLTYPQIYDELNPIHQYNIISALTPQDQQIDEHHVDRKEFVWRRPHGVFAQDVTDSEIPISQDDDVIDDVDDNSDDDKDTQD